MRIFVFLVMLTICIVSFVYTPMIVIWAINILFNAGIVYSWKVWLAFWVLWFVLVALFTSKNK